MAEAEAKVEAADKRARNARYAQESAEAGGAQMKLLLEAKADPFAATAEGWSALLLSSQRGRCVDCI